MNTKLSITVIAGNSAAATLAHAADRPGQRGHGPEVQICDASGKSTGIVTPAPELTAILSQHRASAGE